MINKTYKILSIFAKTPWQKFTFKQVKKLCKSKSESYVYNTLKYFVKQGILQQENIGNVLLYSIRRNPKAITNLAIVLEYESWIKKQIPYKDIENIVDKIPTNYYTLIITGSYAKNKHTNKSDIDIVIISNIESKKIYAELRYACEMNIPSIHLYVFTGQEFLQMLLDKKPNYGKEIVKNNLILFGAGNYCKILLEAMRNGFIG